MWLCVFCLFLCGLLLLVFCVVFAFGSLCFGSCFLERDKEIGLCIGPVDFCGSHTALDGKKNTHRLVV